MEEEIERIIKEWGSVRIITETDGQVKFFELEEALEYIAELGDEPFEYN